MQSPRDFSMYGAVDLGARQAAAQRRQQAARAAAPADAGDGGQAAGPASAFVIDVTEETFNNEVALRSRSDAGDRGPVGRVVRPVQAAEPGA